MTNGESLFKYYEKLELTNFKDSHRASNEFPRKYWHQLSKPEQLNWESISANKKINSIIR